jgi:hypothetical protein
MAIAHRRDDRGAGLEAAVEPAEEAAQTVPHGRGQGVAAVGAVDGQPGDLVADLEADPVGAVSGAGVLLTMLGGYFLFGASRPLLAEFHRKKVYDDDPSPAAEAVLAAE